MEKITKTFTIQISKSTIVIALIFLALGYFVGNTLPITGSASKITTAGSGSTAPESTTATPIKIDDLAGDDPFVGNANAPVIIVEFLDYQCPFCADFHGKDLIARVESAYPEIKKQYIDTGKVKFVFKDYAFLGQESLWAGEAADCAGEQGKYVEFHDYLYDNWKGENQGFLTKANLKSFAKTLGLDSSKFDSCLDSDKYLSEIQEDTVQGQTYGVRGTPGFFIAKRGESVNDVTISGAAPFAQFKSVIDSKLSA